ncbi:MAG: hypothetical protein HOQ07_00350 [Sinomonas sp.]|nr:hypothetical protein [Sinomonas sp.]
MSTLTRPPADPSDRKKRPNHGLRRWLLEGIPEVSGQHQGPHGVPQEHHKAQSWW